MGRLKSRLNRLEARAPDPRPQGELSVGTRVLLTAIERWRALRDGQEPPAYSPEEEEEMHRDDLEIVAGRGVVRWLRDSGGWDSPESRAFLVEWEEDARRRVAGFAEGRSPAASDKGGSQ